MTVAIDMLEEAAHEASEALRDQPQRCGCCSWMSCREPKDSPARAPLVEAIKQFGDSWDRRALRLDPVTASVILHPRFPRFGVTPCEADADVIPEVLQLPLSSGYEAAAIVWHMAQGRSDADALAAEAEARWDELQDLAAELNGGAA